MSDTANCGSSHGFQPQGEVEARAADPGPRAHPPPPAAWQWLRTSSTRLITPTRRCRRCRTDQRCHVGALDLRHRRHRSGLARARSGGSVRLPTARSGWSTRFTSRSSGSRRTAATPARSRAPLMRRSRIPGASRSLPTARSTWWRPRQTSSACSDEAEPRSTGSFQIPKPVSVAVSEDRVVVGAISGSRFSRSDGKPIKIVGSRGKGDDQFDYVHGVAIGDNGNIYVVDSWNNRLSAYDPTGKRLWIKRTGKPQQQRRDRGRRTADRSGAEGRGAQGRRGDAAAAGHDDRRCRSPRRDRHVRRHAQRLRPQGRMRSSPSTARPVPTTVSSSIP